MKRRPALRTVRRAYAKWTQAAIDARPQREIDRLCRNYKRLFKAYLFG